MTVAVMSSQVGRFLDAVFAPDLLNAAERILAPLALAAYVNTPPPPPFRSYMTPRRRKVRAENKAWERASYGAPHGDLVVRSRLRTKLVGGKGLR